MKMHVKNPKSDQAAYSRTLSHSLSNIESSSLLNLINTDNSSNGYRSRSHVESDAKTLYDPSTVSAQCLHEKNDKLSPCVICMQDNKDVVIFKNPQCQHQFHANCIATWMKNPINLMFDGVNDKTQLATCPTCRDPYDFKSHESLKKYSKILGYYEAVSFNCKNWLPYIDVMIERLSSQHDSESNEAGAYIADNGSVQPLFWKTEPNLTGFIKFIEDCANNLQFLKQLVLEVDLSSVISVSNETGRSVNVLAQLSDLIGSIDDLSELFLAIKPPYVLNSASGLYEEAERVQVGQSVPNSGGDAAVTVSKLMAFNEAVSANIRVLDLGSVFEAIVLLKQSQPL